MKRWLLHTLLISALAALGFWGWRAWFPGPEQVIRRQLAELAQTASFSAGQSPLSKLANAQKIGAFFLPEVEIILEVPGRSQAAFRSRDELLEAALAAAAAAASLDIKFVDIRVALAPDRQSAVASLTVQAGVNQEKNAYVQELKISWTKFEGNWRIRRVESVKTLSAAPGPGIYSTSRCPRFSRAKKFTAEPSGNPCSRATCRTISRLWGPSYSNRSM